VLKSHWIWLWPWIC